MNMMFVGYLGLDLYNANGNLVEKGPVYSDGSVTPDILRFELERIGYHTLEPRVLNVADYGVLQKRKRVIFIGYRKAVEDLGTELAALSSFRSLEEMMPEGGLLLLLTKKMPPFTDLQLGSLLDTDGE